MLNIKDSKFSLKGSGGNNGKAIFICSDNGLDINIKGLDLKIDGLKESIFFKEKSKEFDVDNIMKKLKDEGFKNRNEIEKMFIEYNKTKDNKIIERILSVLGNSTSIIGFSV